MLYFETIPVFRTVGMVLVAVEVGKTVGIVIFLEGRPLGPFGGFAAFCLTVQL